MLTTVFFPFVPLPTGLLAKVVSVGVKVGSDGLKLKDFFFFSLLD